MTKITDEAIQDYLKNKGWIPLSRLEDYGGKLNYLVEIAFIKENGDFLWSAEIDFDELLDRDFRKFPNPPTHWKEEEYGFEIIRSLLGRIKRPG